MSDSSNSIWTMTLDYFATGEGRTLMGRIGYATSADSARGQFAEAFGDFFGKGCSIEQGVVRNEVTRFLWSEHALTYFEQPDDKGAVEATSQLHFNFS